LGSVSREEIDNKTLEMVRAGLHWSFKMSKQIAPFLLICSERKRRDSKKRQIEKSRKGRFVSFAGGFWLLYNCNHIDNQVGDLAIRTLGW
jgi:hypothetical protein